MKTNPEVQQDLRALLISSQLLRKAQKNYFADRTQANFQNSKLIERDFDIEIASLHQKYNGNSESLDLQPVPEELPFSGPADNWILFPEGQNILKARYTPMPAPGEPDRIEVVFKSGSTYHYFQTGSLSLAQEWSRWIQQAPLARMDYFIRNIRTKLRYIKAEGE